MNRFFKLAGLMLAMIPSLASAENVSIAASELPKPVMEAVANRFPKATVIAAEKETVGGETLYRVKYKIVETVGQCVVTADGLFKNEPKVP